MGRTDRDLAALCLGGDPHAMRELVARFEGDVYALCWRLLRHRQDAEDVAQEVFVRAFRSLARWDPERPLRPWILTIAVNRCRTAIGRRAARPEPVEYLHELPARPGQDGPPAELVAEIQAALDDLRDDWREVFVLFHDRGQSYESIAQAVGRPVGTVKTWLHRARAVILQRLRQQGLVPNDEPSPAPTRP